MPLKHRGLGQRPKCLITTLTLKSVRLAAQDSIIHTKQLFIKAEKKGDMLLIYLPFRATDWICCCFICDLMAIMITPPDGMLSLAKVTCILVNPALHTSHVCCILDKMGGALMLPETGSVFGVLRSYNWNSTLVVIDGVSRAHEYTLSNGFLDLWPCPLVGHMTLRPCLSQIPHHCPEPHQSLDHARLMMAKKVFPQQFLLFRTIFRSGSCFLLRLNRADSKTGSYWFTEEIPICSDAVGQPFPPNIVS